MPFGQAPWPARAGSIHRNQAVRGRAPIYLAVFL